MRTRVACRSLSLALIAMLAVACSSSSSSGSLGAPTPASSRPAVDRAAVDRAAVQSALNGVVAGLRTVTSVAHKASLTHTAALLQQASGQLDTAGNSLNPSPAGVPAAVSLPVSTAVLRIAGLFHVSASCLAHQAQAASPTTKPCVAPLRQANARTGALAHALVSLAAFGTESPKRFESDLVTALHGR